jgi:hypothetical protein
MRRFSREADDWFDVFGNQMDLAPEATGSVAPKPNGRQQSTGAILNYLTNRRR